MHDRVMNVHDSFLTAQRCAGLSAVNSRAERVNAVAILLVNLIEPDMPDEV
jgi:hypothetical protein